MQVVTRTAGAQDAASLQELDRHLAPDALAKVVADGRVMVAEVDDRVVGCLRWGLLWDQLPFMNLLWLLRDWRGQGLGSALVESWEESQRAVGHPLVLTSTVSAESAQHFYRRLGYVDCGTLLLPDEPAELLFRKALSR